MDDHSFCRSMLSSTMPLVKSILLPSEIQQAWTWKSGKHFEFHGPKNFFHQCSKRVDCKWSAAAEGWNKWLDTVVPGRK